jgi:hypothetical protein
VRRSGPGDDADPPCNCEYGEEIPVAVFAGRGWERGVAGFEGSDYGAAWGLERGICEESIDLLTVSKQELDVDYAFRIGY